MRFSKILLRLFGFLLLTLSTQAQPYPLTVTVNIAPPYTNRWQDYTGNGNRIQVRVTNNTTTPYTFYLAGAFLKVPERTVGVQALAIPIPSQRLSIAGGFGSVSVYSGTQLAQFFANSGTNVQAVGLSDEELSRGVMPEGTYQLCLTAYDNQGQPLSDPLEGCSQPIQISWLLPPRLTLPLCESIVRANPVQQVTFNWTPPSGAGLIASQMEYRFTLVEVPDGMDPNYALNNATYPVLDTVVPVTSLNYTNANPPLISGRTYAWRVQARDKSGNVGMLNNGLSQPCSFTYSEGFQAQIVYPPLNEWVPFTGFPVIVQFGPYSSTYKRFESSLTFSNADLPGTRNRTLRWPNGPLSSQQDAGVPVVNTQQASQITVFPTSEEPNYLSRFRRGDNYNFSGTVRLGYQLDHAPLTAAIRGQFKIGMSPSSLSLPANNDTVAPGKIRFAFKTADRPSKLIPDFLIQQRQRGEASPSYYDGEVLEKWVLEVCQNSNFTGKVDTVQGSVGGRKRLLGIANPEALAAELYRDMEREIQIDSSGKYFWRVKWVNKPDSETDTSAYQYSSTYLFYVKERNNTRIDTTQENPTPSSCVANCDEPVPTNRVTSTNAAVGQIVQIGKFALTIQEIEWVEGRAIGKGAIAIPFMNARVLVSFNNLQINTDNRVIDGEVNADYETQQAPNLGNGATFLSNLGGMSEAQLNTLTGFIAQGGRLISQLSGSNPMRLPLGIDNRVGDQQYIIGVVGMKFTPQRATLNAMVRLDIEGTYGWLSLGASDLCFHPRGLAGTGRGFLYNPADKTIPFGSTRLVFKQTQFAPGGYQTILDSGTYVRWDCEGFKALQIKGEIIFGTDIALKELPDGSIAPDSVVKSPFRATLRQAKNFVFTFTMDRFQSPFARGYGFEVQEAVLDLSDFETPEGVRFPANYPFTQAKSLWRGFYLGRMAMHFPPDFQGNGGRRLSMSVGGILIDRNGLSCDLKLRNVVSPDNCTVDGWAFGIDSVNFRMVANSFNDAGMFGRFKLPISPQMLTYACVISSFQTPYRGTQYSFRVGSADTLDVPLWLAKLKLSPGTTFGINYTSVAAGGSNRPGAPQSGFALEADLHGALSIKGYQQPVGEIDFPLVRFQNLRVQTREPYIGCGPGGGTDCVKLAFGQASPAKNAGGFPVSLDSVFLDVNQSIHPLEIDKTPGARVGIGAKISIITEQNKNAATPSNRGSSFQCTSVLRFRGRLATSPLGWTPTGLVADSVIVKGRSAAVDVDGRLVFYADDAVYGSGFKGEVQAEIKPGFRLRAFAQFGTKETTDYWFVDGMFAAPQGIPLGASGIAFYGFGGGAYRNMRMDGVATLPTSTTADSSRLTRSQYRYVPDLTASTIGIRASIALGAIKKEMFYGEGTIDVAVSPTEGLQSLSLQGNCWFFKNNSGTDNTVRGNFNFTYLHPVRTFDGRIAVYVNVLGGKLRGLGENDLAGRMSLHFSPETWYIKLGEPVADVSQRVGLQFEVSSSIKPRFSAYLAAGRQLPPIPEPATPVLRQLAASIPASNVALATESDGFMFGASASLSTGPQTIADMFRYSFGVELGFDFALKDLNRVRCANASGNGSFTPGMNGWYAQGQLYAGVSGALGIKLPVLMSDYVNVVDFGANFIMRGGFVNPTYLDGVIQARLNILGGLINIPDARLPFQLGERCSVVQESPLADVELIADLTPPHDPQGRNKVDVNTNPQLMANFPLGRPFALETVDENGAIRAKYFRVVINQLSISNLDSNTQHPFVQIPSPTTPELVTLAISRAMQANSRYRVEASLQAQFASVAYPYSNNYIWEAARKADNSLVTESRRNDFMTGSFPVRLRDDQVFHAYPLRNQRYLLQAECPKGYVALSQESNSVVFRPDDRPGTTTRFLVRFIALDGSQAPIEVPITRSSSFYTPPPPPAPNPLPENYFPPVMPRMSVPIVQFDIPNLRNAKVYALQIIRKVEMPAGLASSAPQFNTSVINNPQLQMIIRRKVLGPLATASGETVVYQYFFRTSMFNTLNQKVNGFTVTQARRETQWILRDLVNVRMSHQEPWEEYDVMETTVTTPLGLTFVYKPLIRMATNFSAPWSSQFVMPNIYNLADRLSAIGGSARRSMQQIFRRLPQGDPGIPPWKAVYLSFDQSTVAGTLKPNETSVVSPLVRSQLASTNLFGDFRLPNGLNANYFAFPSGYSSQTTLSYYLPNQTQFDWASLRSYAQRLVAIYGQPETSEFFPYDLRPAIRRLLNNQYEYMRPGNYDVIFRFNPPFGQCATTDESANQTGAIKSIPVQ